MSRDRRGALARCAAAVSALLMVLAVGMVVLQDDAGSRRRDVAAANVELSAAGAVTQSLWEPDDSVNHDPYFNVFDDGQGTQGHYTGDEHKEWSKEVVRERVWQTLKDVKAMERHVREQNALNNKMKTQISTLEEQAQDEKKVIRALIQKGMEDVTTKISLLKNAAMANVSDVRALLLRIEGEQTAKQEAQDKAIDDLTARHQQLQSETTNKFQEVDSQISAAEQRLAEAKARVAHEREEVKKLIMDKIKTDVGGLDKQMTDRLENEKFDIRNTIDAGLKQLDGNISDYSLATGIRVARLMNKVAVLKKDQKKKSEAQDKAISGLEDDHKELKEQTLDTLGKLRSEVDETKEKLSKAQKTLEAEQALRQSAEEKQLDTDTAKLHSATEQSLADAKDEVKLQIGRSNAWAHQAFAHNKDAFHHSVDDLEQQLQAFVKKTKAAGSAQGAAIQGAQKSADAKITQAQGQVDDEEREVKETTTAVALANAQLKGEVAEQTKALRLELLKRMTAVQDKMTSSLASVRTALADKVTKDEAALDSELKTASATATGVIDSVNADLQQTKTVAQKLDKESKEQLAAQSESEKALSESTGEEMKALGAQMKALDTSMAQARAKLTSQAESIEKGLTDKLDVQLKHAAATTDAAMGKARSEVEDKMSADMATVSSKIEGTDAAATAAADKLHAKVHQVEAGAKAAAAETHGAVEAAEKKHAAFEAHAMATLSHVEDSLAHTRAALKAADEQMQTLLAAREAALKAKMEGEIKEEADATVEKVKTEAATVKAAHDALAQAMAAHKAATEAAVAERKEKLERLAADLQDLQGKMKAVEALAAGHADAPAAAEQASEKVQQRGRSMMLAAERLAQRRKGGAKAAAALPSHDRSARQPQPVRMGGDMQPRAFTAGMLRPAYYAQAAQQSTGARGGSHH